MIKTICARRSQLANKVAPDCTAASGRKAFSLLEVMIGASVMAILLSAMVSQVATLRNTQQLSDQSERIADIVHLLHEKIVATPYDDLQAEPWSIERPLGGDTWMGDAADLPKERQLVRSDAGDTLGLLEQRSGLRDLQIYLDYYLAFDSEIYGVAYDGLLDESVNKAGDYTAEVLNRCRLQLPISDLAGAPVIIRLTVEWENQSWNTFIARRALIMRTRQGMTLLEIIMASAIMVVLMVAVTEGMASLVLTTRGIQYENDLAWEAARIEKIFSRDLSESGWELPAWNDGADPTGLSGGVTDYGVSDLSDDRKLVYYPYTIIQLGPDPAKIESEHVANLPLPRDVMLHSDMNHSLTHFLRGPESLRPDIPFAYREATKKINIKSLVMIGLLGAQVSMPGRKKLSSCSAPWQNQMMPKTPFVMVHGCSSVAVVKTGPLTLIGINRVNSPMITLV